MFGQGEAGSHTGFGGVGPDADNPGSRSGAISIGTSETGEASTPPPSCEELADSCGPGSDEDCCTTLRVPGGTFWLGRRSGDPDSDVCDANGNFICQSNETPGVLATVGAFGLDRFEVTIARFRKFIEAGSPKPGGSTGEPRLRWEMGWSLPSTPAEWSGALACNPLYLVWTDEEGDNEDRPVNCIDWFSAHAFCIWDGGFLPTEAEWELAASGGEERVFPWSSAGTSTITERHAVYSEPTPGVVGSRSPAGDGRWGHADLAGGVWEWTLDTYAEDFPYSPCNDCVNATDDSNRVLRGGGFNNPESFQRAASRAGQEAGIFASGVGLRCARSD